MPAVVIPKVVHLTPDFAAAHHYNQQLVKHLRALGLHLKTINSKNFLKPVLQFHPAIVHVHWLHSFTFTDDDGRSAWNCLWRTSWFILQLAIIRLSGAKLVWTVHELDIPETRHPDLDRLCNRLVVLLSSTVVAHCDKARREIIETYCRSTPDKVQAIPHGHFVEVIDNSSNRTQARQALNISPDKLVVLFFGLIRPYKGVLELIDAYKRLDNPAVELLIVGNTVGHHVECVEYLARVYEAIAGVAGIRLILEFVPDNEIQKYMNASDVVVFPYRSVMTSGALILAMGFGKPCIARRVGCVDETVDERGSFLYDSVDVSGLPNALQACVEKRDNLAAMGEHNRKLAEGLNWELVAELTTKIYQRHA